MKEIKINYYNVKDIIDKFGTTIPIIAEDLITIGNELYMQF